MVVCVQQKLRKRKAALPVRCCCTAASAPSARKRSLNSHSLETPEASQPAKLSRCSHFANVQGFDEYDVKDGQMASKGKIACLRRDASAVSPDDAVEGIDLHGNFFEALLSCPHANPKFVSETQMPGMQFSSLALERRIAIARRVIAAPDCIHFLLLQPCKRHKLKNPSMQSPGGKAISGEVIVGHANPVFQGGNAKICAEFRPKVRLSRSRFVEKASESPQQPARQEGKTGRLGVLRSGTALRPTEHEGARER
jgi:hypothetical protein